MRYDLEILGERAGGGVEARHYAFEASDDGSATRHATDLFAGDFRRVIDYELCRQVLPAPGTETFTDPWTGERRDVVSRWETVHPMGDAHEGLFCEALRARGGTVLEVVEEGEGGALLRIKGPGAN